MLAGKAPDDLSVLRFPIIGSPKVDGVRAVVLDGVVLSRNLLPIPNAYVQARFGKKKYNGLDGELVIGDPADSTVFNRTQSAVMTKRGKPDVKFLVFDYVLAPTLTWEHRFERVKKLALNAAHVYTMPYETIGNVQGVTALETAYLEMGYEGLMLRDPHGGYKFGRSTTREGLLLKLKRFEDAEARVVAVKALERNTNEARTGGLAQRRSSARSGRVADELLGALVCERADGVVFDVGTGFSLSERQALWAARDTLVGRLVRYRFFAGGVVDKPRFPVFAGFRDPIDA